MDALAELRRKKKKAVVVDWLAVETLKGLRDDVLTQGEAKSKLTKHGTYQTVDEILPYETIGKYEVYYQIKPFPDGKTFRSYIYLRCPDEDISQIPQKDLEPIIGAIYAVFVVPGQSRVEIRVGNGQRKDSMLFMQDFQPLLLTERNPRQRVPDISKLQ